MTVENKEVTSELLSRFEKFDSYRQQYDQKAIEAYKLYVGHQEPRDDGKSNLHIPRTYEVIDTLRARMLKAFFDQRPYIDFIPQPEGSSVETMSLSEEKAEVAGALVDMQLDRNDCIKKFYDYITSFLIFPCAIMGVGWRYEEELIKKRVPKPNIVDGRMSGWRYEDETSWETTWDDNEIVNIDYFDFWPDPKGRDLDSCRGVFHREWLTREQLESKLELLSQVGEGTVYDVDLERVQGADVTEGRQERMSLVGLDISGESYNQESKKDSFELLHYWEDKRHAIVVNRCEVVYDGPSPYWRHRKKPFIVSSYEPLPNEFYGMSAVQIIEHLQKEENTQHNQRMDNVNFVLNKMWKVRKGADVDEDELISRPHGIIHVDNPDDVTTFEMNDVVGSAFRSEMMTGKSIENALGAPPVVRGAEGRRGKTATEVSEQASSAGIRFDVKIMLFESLGIKRLAKLMDMNNQQFIDDERVVNLGKDAEQKQWQQVTPAELMGNFDYRPAGANIDPASNKVIRREQLTQMFTFLMQSGNPYVDYKKMTKEWLQAFDIRNPDKFLKSEEEIQAEMMQQQQAQQQTQQAPPGGASY